MNPDMVTLSEDAIEIPETWVLIVIAPIISISFESSIEIPCVKFAIIRLFMETSFAATVIPALDEFAIGGAPKPSELSTVKIVPVLVWTPSHSILLPSSTALPRKFSPLSITMFSR